jgi:hypothetical protein
MVPLTGSDYQCCSIISQKNGVLISELALNVASHTEKVIN